VLFFSGRGGSGKSNLCIRFVYNQFMEEYDPTIEDDFKQITRVDGIASQVRIYDTAGQEEWGHSYYREAYYRDAHGFLMVCDCASRHAAEELVDLHNKIRRTKDLEDDIAIPIVVAYNKIDLFMPSSIKTNKPQMTTPPDVTIDQVHAWNDWIKKYKIDIVPTSAKENVNVEEAFHKLIRLIRKDRMEKYKQKLSKEQQDQKSKCNLQ